jgi:hypothetical protein
VTREIEQSVAEAIPHIPGCRAEHGEWYCSCGAKGKRARMLAAIQMHVDEKTRGRVYLDRPRR